jgi:acyl-CoA synthetase (AMP-forming)/AMP-acid ligase II
VIQEAAAIAVPDFNYGEVVGAWIVLQPGATISREEVRKSVVSSMNPQVRLELTLQGRKMIILRINDIDHLECSDLGLVRRGGRDTGRVAEDGKWEGYEACLERLEP